MVDLSQLPFFPATNELLSYVPNFISQMTYFFDTDDWRYGFYLLIVI